MTASRLGPRVLPLLLALMVLAPAARAQEDPPPATGSISGLVSDAASGAPIEGALVGATGPETLSATTAADGSFTLADADPGEYTVGADHPCGWSGASANATVVSGETATADLALGAVAGSVTGTVTDLRGGWPVYSRITGGPAAAFTSPEAGTYTITGLTPCQSYTLTASAEMGAYGTSSTTFTATEGTVTRNFSLALDDVACSAPGYRWQGIYEQFEGYAYAPPAGWAVQTRGGGGYGTGGYTGAVWRFDDPPRRGNLTGGAGGFAAADQDYYVTCDSLGQCSYRTTDTWLVSPPIDFSALPPGARVYVQFDSDLKGTVFGRAQASVIAGQDCDTQHACYGGFWSYDGTRRTRHEVADVTSRAAGASRFRVAFMYQAVDDQEWWQVDNVRIAACVPAAGLAVGHVTRAANGAALNGATVTNGSFGATSVATPGDPALGDGLYAIGVAGGANTLTGSAWGYGERQETANGVAGQAVRRDIALPDDIEGTPPFRTGVASKSVIKDVVTGGGDASATANANGTFDLSSHASSDLPAGTFVSGSTTAVGASQSSAVGRIDEVFAVRAGQRIATARVSFGTLNAAASAYPTGPSVQASAVSWVRAWVYAAVVQCTGGGYSGCTTAGPVTTGPYVYLRCGYYSASCATAGSQFEISAALNVPSDALLLVQVIVQASSQTVGEAQASAAGAGSLVQIRIS